MKLLYDREISCDYVAISCSDINPVLPLENGNKICNATQSWHAKLA